MSKDQEKFRRSLRHVSHHCTDKDEEDEFYHVRTKSIFGEEFRSFLKNAKNFEMRLKSKDDETPVYGNFVLPGSIYLFHPYIGNGKYYQQYEETKSELTKVCFCLKYDLVSQNDCHLSDLPSYPKGSWSHVLSF